MIRGVNVGKMSQEKKVAEKSHRVGKEKSHRKKKVTKYF